MWASYWAGCGVLLGKPQWIDVSLDCPDESLIGYAQCSVLTDCSFVAACPVWGEEGVNSDDVRAGHRLAILVCANCHVAAADQPSEPILQPPASSFESIAQRKSVNADWLQDFMKTTHRGLDNPKGMPNPELLDLQIKQVIPTALKNDRCP